MKNQVDNKIDKNSIITIIALSIPVIVENVLQVLIGTIDTFFISRLGTKAINGVSATNLVMNIYIAFFTALGIGTTALISRKIGRKNKLEANMVLKQSLLLSIFIGILIGVINMVFGKNLLGLLGLSTKDLSYIYPYFISVTGPVIFLCMMMTLSSGLRGAGDTNTPMKISLIVNIINVILNYLLIFGLYKFKGLGILGAGIATSVSRLIGTILLMGKVNGYEKILHIDIFRDWKINLETQKSIIKIGLPAAVEKLIMRFGQLLYGSLIIDIGSIAYASHNIAGTIESYSYLPGIGFGVAGAVLVSQELGAGNKEKAKKLGLTSYILSSIFMVLIGIIFYIFAPNLARIFVDDQEIISLVVRVLRIIAFFQPMLCATLVLTSILQGVGDTKFPMYSTFFGIWVIRILGVYILGIKLKMGLVGVWISYALDVTIRGLILMIRYLKGKWKDIEID